MTTYNYNALYKLNAAGALQCWQVAHDGAGKVTVTYGLEGGKLQSTTETVKGKNAGKANATTPEQQAKLRADQLFEAKLKEGYTLRVDDARAGKSALEGVEPMLAHVYQEKLTHVVWPAIAQPKLDGMRCLAIIESGEVKLFSRTQKPITTLPHIEEQLLEVFSGVDGRLVLDGELYNHELKDNFNKILSVIKRDQVHADAKLIQFHVYDVVAPLPFDERFPLACGPIEFWAPEHIKIVQTTEVDCEQALRQWFSDCTAAGYEGAMYRHLDAPYEHKRSNSLLKFKEMTDAEFEIIGVEEGKGKLEGKAGAIWCRTKEGKEFKAKMMGALETLTDYLTNFEHYRGKLLTVRFQNLTPDGVPRFPVGVRVRHDE